VSLGMRSSCDLTTRAGNRCARIRDAMTKTTDNDDGFILIGDMLTGVLHLIRTTMRSLEHRVEVSMMFDDLRDEIETLDQATVMILKTRDQLEEAKRR
jgi:hypothetical protein